MAGCEVAAIVRIIANKDIFKMFKADVYKIAVLSLSGIMEEVYTAQEVISKWNQENAEQTGNLYLPLAAEAAASEADVVIGIVGNYIKKAEVIEEAVKTGKKVLFFLVSIKTRRILSLRREEGWWSLERI